MYIRCTIQAEKHIAVQLTADNLDVVAATLNAYCGWSDTDSDRVARQDYVFGKGVVCSHLMGGPLAHVACVGDFVCIRETDDPAELRVWVLCASTFWTGSSDFEALEV